MCVDRGCRDLGLGSCGLCRRSNGGVEGRLGVFGGWGDDGGLCNRRERWRCKDMELMHGMVIGMGMVVILWGCTSAWVLID